MEDIPYILMKATSFHFSSTQRQNEMTTYGKDKKRSHLAEVIF